MKKIVLIDGNNLLFRSFFATSYTGNIMKNSKGFATNALYGFINMLNKIIDEEQPSHIMVAFDKGKTFRHEKYKEYKSGRSEMPNELREQFPVAKNLVELMGITYYEIDNYEADDIIGTFAKYIDDNDDIIGTIISSDKDLLQLISDKIEVKLLKQTGYIRMNKDTFIDTYHVPPINMIDIKALMGDPSDNIPGVKGIGEKTAINLLEEYQTIENLYNNIDKIKGKTKEKLELDKDNAFFSKEIATIYKEVPLSFQIDDTIYRGYQTNEYIELLTELEFYSLIKKIDFSKKIQTQDVKIEYQIIDDINDLKLNSDFSIYVEILGDNYHKDPIIGFSIHDGKNSYFLKPDVILQNKNILESEYIKSTYDLKKLIVCLNRLGLKITNCSFDLMIASYLLNYNVKDDISYLANNLNYNMKFYEEIYGKGSKLKVNEDDNSYILEMINRAIFIYKNKEDIITKLQSEEQMYLFEEIEMPLCSVLADMEITGIKVNRDYLTEYGEIIEKEIKELEIKIFELAQTEFNISSPKQLADILFIQMKIPYPKKIRDNNYSTSKDILDKLTDYEIIKYILRYRVLTKLKSTYIEGLSNEIASDGRIHTIYTQTLTRTGRLSSTSPNLQNIPMRIEEGRKIRKAFLPDDDSYLLSSDYSQIELRLFASLSKTDELIQAFIDDKDIHTKTASDIFNIDEEEVTKDMRRTAKAVNFGIIYGISGFGLSEDLGIDLSSAKQFIDDYLNTYPGIKQYMENSIKDAHEKGYVETIMKRKRIIEELNNKNYIIRSQGERIALNTPIQGSAAEILKKAMIDIYKEFIRLNLKSKILLQVHDELVINVTSDEIDIVKNIVKEKMENVYQFDVPLKVEMDFGKDWYQAK